MSAPDASRCLHWIQPMELLPSAYANKELPKSWDWALAEMDVALSLNNQQ